MNASVKIIEPGAALHVHGDGMGVNTAGKSFANGFAGIGNGIFLLVVHIIGKSVSQNHHQPDAGRNFFQLGGRMTDGGPHPCAALGRKAADSLSNRIIQRLFEGLDQCIIHGKAPVSGKTGNGKGVPHNAEGFAKQHHGLLFDIQHRGSGRVRAVHEDIAR